MNDLSESQSSDLPEIKPQQPVGSETPGPGVTPEKPVRPSRTGRFFRAVLRWVVILLVLFSIGVLLTWFLRVRPLEQEKATAVSAQTTSQQQAVVLGTQLASASATAALASASEAHIALLQTLNQVTTARLALANKDAAGAKKALSAANTALVRLSNYAATREADRTTQAGQRLTLATSEVDRDTQTATSDLGILNDLLLELEKRLFGG